MCDTCGCGDPKVVPVDVHERILAGNDRAAAHNRVHFREHGVVAVNLMGSPGAGKTAVLETTARRLAGRERLGALAGDLATDRDAERLRAAGITAASITTGSACHLDADMVHCGLHELPWRDLDYLFIENVGNLVCPAIYDLGQEANVVVLSVTEGEDKPLKYPVMFRKADLVLITKIDLLPHLAGVRLEAIVDALARVMPEPEFIPLSVVTGEGVERWLAWLERLERFGPARLSRTAGSLRL
ncbi:MAG: hydrogenase accessory protein HypB [Acidobacteria bacterium RIFCSPLOWO2_02_FULL_68_18]|nr:MAG: hydrogenase accessory protein HypB [Acidobacteria bacterium RIFCSPLOWO2_02_FULL_68_18]OFW48689.1 MAG: hydrogenase accessory protein HypB [Acidobacteria bacterium RIFCSPLOWO2_12_FULL_68_19]